MSLRFVGASSLAGASQRADAPTFTEASTAPTEDLGLALAPALTPAGVDPDPSFFRGFAIHPQVLARGLVTLSDITATRYYEYTPSNMRDPVLTAHGDRLRAEVFSACNGVYARLDLLGPGFDGGEIAHGTTNVDIGLTMRQSLSRIGAEELLHLSVGHGGLRVSAPTSTAHERPVEMPDRWIRALGNLAQIEHGLVPAFALGRAATRTFVSGLPGVRTQGLTGWLTPVAGPGGTTCRLGRRAVAGAVHLAGPHRLTAVKRLLPHLEGLTVYGPQAPEVSGKAAEDHIGFEFRLPSARLMIALTPVAWRGFSGEGSLLTALSEPHVLDDADLVSALLSFEPKIDVPELARGAALPAERVTSALAVLAASGRVGWDSSEQAWFHRELPDDPERVEKDNPRLVRARRFLDEGHVRQREGLSWSVTSGDRLHLVRLQEGTEVGEAIAEASVTGASGADPVDGARCTCPWYARHQGRGSPCAHVLAVRMAILGGR